MNSTKRDAQKHGNVKNKIITATVGVVFAISLVLFIITFSIGLPIYVRPFYYMQIESLGIDDDTGYSKEQIKEAYDEVLDFLTLGKEYGTGVFKYSESGKSHFEDCKILFDLNATVLIISSALLLIITVLKRLKLIKIPTPLGFGISFWSGVSTLAVFSLIGVLAATNFARAFTIFHKIFFPGKSNWYFDPYTDGIILAMPADFFMSCAILILVSIITISVLSIVLGIIKKKRGKNLF